MTYLSKTNHLLERHEHKLVVGHLWIQCVCLHLQHRKVLFMWSIIAAMGFFYKNKLFSDDLGTPGFA